MGHPTNFQQVNNLFQMDNNRGAGRLLYPPGKEEWGIIEVRLNETLVPGFAGAPGFEVIDSMAPLRAPAYDPDAVEEQFFGFMFPLNYALGTRVHIGLSWSGSTKKTGETVRWGMDIAGHGCTDTQPGGVAPMGFPGEPGRVGRYFAESKTAGEAVFVESEFGQGPAFDTSLWKVKGRLFRDATNPKDTYNADAYVSSLQCHYRINTLGGSGPHNK